MEYKPGRELDALIAEKVMGYKRGPKAPTGRYYWSDGGASFPFSPSTDIAAAWEVFQTIAKRWEDPWAGFVFDGKELIWSCHFSRQILGGIVGEAGAHADTAPHAICLAALKAVEGK